MKKVFKAVKNTKTRNGLFTIRYSMSTGFGESIDGWALNMEGNTSDGYALIDLGIDEDSEYFRRLLVQSRSNSIRRSSGFLGKIAGRKTLTENLNTSRSIEAEVAKLTLMQFRGTEALTHHSLVHNLVRVAEMHSPSLQAIEYYIKKQSIAVA